MPWKKVGQQTQSGFLSFSEKGEKLEIPSLSKQKLSCLLILTLKPFPTSFSLFDFWHSFFLQNIFRLPNLFFVDSLCLFLYFFAARLAFFFSLSLSFLLYFL